MNLDKVGITLYDLIGYLLPGYVWLIALSIIEATFLRSTVLSLSNFGRHAIPFTIVAYFLGQISHSLGSQLQVWKKNWFKKDDTLMGAFVAERVGQILREMYVFKDQAKLDKHLAVLLADGYVLASGGSPERDVLQSREGFFKASMVGFGFLTLTLFCTLIKHGVHLHINPQLIVQYSPGKTVLMALALGGVMLLFRSRMNFFRAIRENTSLALFLAHREKDLLTRPPVEEKKIELARF